MKKIRNPLMDKLRARKEEIGKMWGFRHIRYYRLRHDLNRPDSLFMSGMLSFDIPDVEVEERINARMDRIWEGKE